MQAETWFTTRKDADAPFGVSGVFSYGKITNSRSESTAGNSKNRLAGTGGEKKRPFAGISCKRPGLGWMLLEWADWERRMSKSIQIIKVYSERSERSSPLDAMTFLYQSKESFL